MKRALLVVLAVVLAACSHPSPTTRYVDAVHHDAPALTFTDEQLIHLGHQVCDLIDTGYTRDDFAYILNDGDPADAIDLSKMADDAIAFLCGAP